MLNQLRNKFATVAAVGTALVMTGGSALAATDVTAVTGEIAAAGAPIAAIGSAVLLILVGVKVYKWVRRAL